jgi:hypothetical protein
MLDDGLVGEPGGISPEAHQQNGENEKDAHERPRVREVTCMRVAKVRLTARRTRRRW